MQDRVWGTSRQCGGSFAKQVAGNVDKREAPTLLCERLEIRLDENLDRLFAGINLNTNRCVAKVHLVTVVRSLLELWYGALLSRFKGSAATSGTIRQWVILNLAASRTTGARRGLFKNAADDRG
jgi:hypothetical protein